MTQTTGGDGRWEHTQAATMVSDLYQSQVKHARELGCHAFEMGLIIADNPFAEDVLYRAWVGGWDAAERAFANARR